MTETPKEGSMVLVTGGTGAIGGVITRRLLAEGYRVRVFARHARRDAMPGVEAVSGDVQDFSAVRSAVEGVDIVVHVVGVLREGGSQTFHGVHVTGTRNLVTAAEQAGARRFIHVGGIHADLEAPDPLSKTKALAEEEVRRGALEQTVLRSSMVFGTPSGVLAGIRGSLRASRPFAILPGGGRGLFQPLWVEDLASCVLACLAGEEFNGRTYELGGPETWSYRELVGLAMRADGLRRLSVSMPLTLVLLAALWPRLIGREPLVTRTELRQLCMDNRTDPEVLPREFGVTPTPLTEAMATTFPPTKR